MNHKLLCYVLSALIAALCAGAAAAQKASTGWLANAVRALDRSGQ